MRKRFWLSGILVIVIIAVLAWLLWPRPQINHQNSEVKQPDTSPSSSQPAQQLSYIDQRLSSMSLRDKVASLFILHTPGVDPAALADYQATHKPSGLIFMGDNIPTTQQQLQALTGTLVTDKQLPPFLAVDEEGDTVKRVAADTFPGALTLPYLPPSAAKEAFAKRSDLLKDVGLNLNFGIIADVTANPKSFIYPRVLGTTPEQAADRVAQAVEGSKGRTLSTIKHFPGHGETGADSHTTIPSASTTFDDWKQRVSIPFRTGINAGTDMLMFGQLRYTAVDSAPATLSKKWHEIARNDLGFKGLIITDDMVMLQDSGEATYANPVNNAIAAINAGNDLLLYVLNHGSANSRIDPNTLIDGVVAAVNDGRIPSSTIDTHARAVLSARHNLGQLLYD